MEEGPLRTAFSLRKYPDDLRDPVLALGMFDGVHLGHQQVIGAAVADARRARGDAVVVTFEPHPLEVLRPSAKPVLLTTVEERLALFEDAAVDLALVLPFDLEFSKLPAQSWLDDVLGRRLRARGIFTGSSYTFGHRREGNTDRLTAWGRDRGIPVHLIPSTLVSGEPVSSSRIRTALAEGLVDEAARLLGRWYALEGRVVPGSGRGHELGFPTANLEIPARKVLPGRGVYATFVDAGGRRYESATNVGHRPTFGGGSLVVETHLLDYNGNLVGDTITVSFVARLRPEQTFAGPAALLHQVRADIQRARELLAGVGPSILQ
jgi:riboflavin kinase / FMN adenylyltransferase